MCGQSDTKSQQAHPHLENFLVESKWHLMTFAPISNSCYTFCLFKKCFLVKKEKNLCILIWWHKSNFVIKVIF